MNDAERLSRNPTFSRRAGGMRCVGTFRGALPLGHCRRKFIELPELALEIQFWPDPLVVQRELHPKIRMLGIHRDSRNYDGGKLRILTA